MSSHHLTPDTQAILLLCASFGISRDIYPQPLSLSEYNSFALWLREQQLRPSNLLGTDPEALLATCNFLNTSRIKALLERGMMLALSVEKWTSQGLWILGRGDKYYPARLKQQLQENAPPILYGVGEIELLSQGGLAVVGSRDLDEEGIAYTERVADICARQGVQIVSGGARGVDTAAMLAAVNEGGTAIGVLADSLAKSAVAKKYRSAIQEQRLTLISAVDPQVGFNVGNAMGRNKYIYALANRALVINADYNKGGTWAGAVEVLKQDKNLPIFVRIEGKVASGNKELIKLGAKEFPLQPWENNLIQKLDDIIATQPPQEFIQGSLFNDDRISIESNKTIDSLPVDEISQKYISKTATVSLSIYDAVLPIILDRLQQPCDKKTLAQTLDVNIKQLESWLKQAIDDGRIVVKKGRRIEYLDNALR